MERKQPGQYEAPSTAWILQGPDPENNQSVRPMAIYTTLADAQQARRGMKTPGDYDILTAPLIGNPQREQHHTVSFVRTEGPDGPSVTQQMNEMLAAFEPQDRVNRANRSQSAKDESQTSRRTAPSPDASNTSDAPYYMTNTAYASGDGASANLHITEVNQESSFMAEMRRTYPHAFPDQNRPNPARPNPKEGPGPTAFRNSMYDAVAEQQANAGAKRQAAKEHALQLLDQLNKECQRIAGNSATLDDTDRSL